MMREMKITKNVIGCAFEVYNTLGFGFLESVYEKSMYYELCNKGLKVRRQHPIEVHYKGKGVGMFTADLLINDRIIVELKSVSNLLPIHEMQLVNYLKATKMDTGLLINFGQDKVYIKRKFRELKANPENPVNPV